ncbi:MAG: hypothetical protein D6714_10545 [Bacteroidetes bacterium]|nr:MAG: hypothetical protein D6714_10545 [Bacteroidota bacterium]
MSFRNLAKSPVAGQLFLFYNSRVKQKSRVPRRVADVFDNSLPPPPPAPEYAQFEQTDSLIHFSRVVSAGGGSANRAGIDAFQRFVVFNYDSLGPEGTDERHLFLEFQNDTTLWNLISEDVENSGDTVQFLAVMTAVSDNPDLLGTLPEANDPLLVASGIKALLDTSIYVGNVSADDLFVSITNSNFKTKVIASSGRPSAVVRSHDPNNLSLYACECPNPVRQKLVGRITFSNDGQAATTAVNVSIKLPPQLDATTFETLSHFPEHTPTGDFPKIVGETAQWNWFAHIEPRQRPGVPEALTRGEIVFSVLLKEGALLADLSPLQACIQFDLNAPECTVPVSVNQIITTVKPGDIAETLKCKTCEKTDRGGWTLPDWCADLPWWVCLLVILFLLILIFWFLNKK